MKFIKGVMVGGMLTSGVIMMYSQMDNFNKKNMMKKGKKFARKIGII